jgi:hypothetical protein
MTQTLSTRFNDFESMWEGLCGKGGGTVTEWVPREVWQAGWWRGSECEGVPVREEVCGMGQGKMFIEHSNANPWATRQPTTELTRTRARAHEREGPRNTIQTMQHSNGKTFGAPGHSCQHRTMK